MPTYSYSCKDCGYFFEKTGSYSEMSDYKPICQKCKSENAKKLYGKVEIIFRGDGFYVNDKNKK